MSNATADEPILKKKRGRPRKEEPITTNVPKKRGRPPKPSSENTACPIKRGKGRPPKELTVEKIAELARLKQKKDELEAKRRKEKEIEDKYLVSWLKELSIYYPQSTISTYKRSVLYFLEYIIDEYHLQPNDVDIGLVTDFVLFRVDEEMCAVKPRTLNKDVMAIRNYYRFLVKKGEVVFNPFAEYKTRRISKNLPNIISIEEVNRIIDQEPEPIENGKALWFRDKAILEVFYSCGTRISELAAIKLTDLKLNQGLVTVTGKGNKQRMLPLGRYARSALSDWLKEREKWPADESDKQYLFISFQSGRKLDRSMIYLIVNRHAKRAGIYQNVYPHLLRHCFATHMLENGLNLIEISEMLGHASVATTQIYTNVDFGFLASEYDKTHPRAEK